MSKPCKLCNGLRYQLQIRGNDFRTIKCPACYGTGELQVGFGEGQDWPNLGVNCPAGSAVGWSTGRAIYALRSMRNDSHNS